jgi:hypothetical protein
MLIVMVVLLVVMVLATMAVNWSEQAQLKSPQNTDSQNAGSSTQHADEKNVA